MYNVRIMHAIKKRDFFETNKKTKKYINGLKK